MEIDRSTFEKLPTLTVPEQQAFLDNIGFELMNEASEYYGKIVDRSEWLSPSTDRLNDFFESECDDPIERMKEYEKDRKLSDAEREKLEDLVIQEALDNEYHLGLFFGSLTSGDAQLVVVAERTGGGWDCEAFLAGIFVSIDDAIEKLRGSDGDLVI